MLGCLTLKMGFDLFKMGVKSRINLRGYDGLFDPKDGV